jgi:hypothetical protein
VTKGKFEFEDVLPGDYTLEVQNPKFCWTDKVRKITVGHADLDTIEFK